MVLSWYVEWQQLKIYIWSFNQWDCAKRGNFMYSISFLCLCLQSQDVTQLLMIHYSDNSLQWQQAPWMIKCCVAFITAFARFVQAVSEVVVKHRSISPLLFKLEELLEGTSTGKCPGMPFKDKRVRDIFYTSVYRKSWTNIRIWYPYRQFQDQGRMVHCWNA